MKVHFGEKDIFEVWERRWKGYRIKWWKLVRVEWKYYIIYSTDLSNALKHVKSFNVLSHSINQLLGPLPLCIEFSAIWNRTLQIPWHRRIHFKIFCPNIHKLALQLSWHNQQKKFNVKGLKTDQLWVTHTN